MSESYIEQTKRPRDNIHTINSTTGTMESVEYNTPGPATKKVIKVRWKERKKKAIESLALAFKVSIH